MPIKVQAWVLFSFVLVNLIGDIICFCATAVVSSSILVTIPMFLATKVLTIIIFIYCRPSQIIKGAKNGIEKI